MEENKTIESHELYPQGHEPSEEQIKRHMYETDENYYNARERLREKAYGGLPPAGYQSWGDYWKAF